MIAVMASVKNVLDVILLLFIFAFVLVLSYFAAKFAGKYQNNFLNKNSNIKIIEYFRLGNNKFIAIAQIGNDYYALGIGKDEITVIDKLSPESLSINSLDTSINNKQSFKEIITQIKNKKEK